MLPDLVSGRDSVVTGKRAAAALFLFGEAETCAEAGETSCQGQNRKQVTKSHRIIHALFTVVKPLTCETIGSFFARLLSSSPEVLAFLHVQPPYDSFLKHRNEMKSVSRYSIKNIIQSVPETVNVEA